VRGNAIVAELASLMNAIARQKIDRPTLARRLRRLADRVEDRTPESTGEKRPDPHDEAALRLFEYWREQCAKGPTTKATPERLRAVRARLAQGYSEATIRAAIDGAAADAYESESGRRFDDLTLICRNGAKLESFVERAGGAEHVEKSNDPRLAELEEQAARALQQRRVDDYNRIQGEIRAHAGRLAARSRDPRRQGDRRDAPVPHERRR
jgi:uncharacterized coiled-coil protein SlyX